MKRFFTILTIILLLPFLSKAQQSQSTQSFTLEQCVEFGLQNSPNIKNAAIDEKIADARVKETRGIGLPQVDGSVALMHNQKLPRMFFKYDPNTPGFIDLSQIPGIQPGDAVAFQNFFQLPSSGSASIGINQLLFNGSYLVGLKAANTYRELSKRAGEQTREQTVQQITKAYYGVLINKDRMKLFDSNIERVESLLKTTTALNTNGFAEGIDVDRIKVTLNNLRTERDKFYNLQELSILLLKFQMNYPMDQPLDVAGDISSLQVDESILGNYALEWDHKQRTDYRLLETNKRLLELDVKNKYSNSLPSLSAFANFGYSTQSPDIGGIFKTNLDIPEASGVGPDKWYPTTSFGLNLNVPLFSGLQRNYRLQQAKLELLKVENQFMTLKSGIDLEIKQSATNFLNAIKSLKSQEENRTLADNIAKVTKIKYEQGVGSNIEVIEAESSLKEAQINYYSALYDALVAKVDLDKAYGKLNQPKQENK